MLSALLGHVSWMEAVRSWCVMLAAAEAIGLSDKPHRIDYENLAVDLRPLPLSVRLVGRPLMITMLTDRRTKGNPASWRGSSPT